MQPFAMPRMPQNDLIASCALILATMLWAGNFIVGRALGGDIPPLTMNWLRWVIAGIAILPFVLREGRIAFAGLRSVWPRLLVLGLLGIVNFNWLLYEALTRIPASIAALVVSLTPVLILTISAVLLGRAIRGLQIIGALIAVSGVGLVLLSEAGLNRGNLSLAGLGFAGSAAISWALYTLLLREWKLPMPPVVALACTIWAGLLLMAPVAIMAGIAATWPAQNLNESIALLYLGLGASLLAFFSWQAGVAGLGPERGGVFLSFIPVFTLFLAVTLLGEALSAAKIFGVALVLVGVVAAQR